MISDSLESALVWFFYSWAALGAAKTVAVLLGWGRK